MKIARGKPEIISLIETDTLIMQAASEDGEDELPIVPAGYFNGENHICHVKMNKRNDE